MSGQEHKYNSFDEFLDAAMVAWDIPDYPKDNEENRALVADGLYWAGVELVRFNHSKAYLFDVIKTLKQVRARWEAAKKDD